MGCKSTRTASRAAPHICDELPPSPTPNTARSTTGSTNLFTALVPDPAPNPDIPPEPLVTEEVLAKRKELNEQAPFTPDSPYQVEVSLVTVKTMKMCRLCPNNDLTYFRRDKNSNKYYQCVNCGQDKDFHSPSRLAHFQIIYPVRVYRCAHCHKTPTDLHKHMRDPRIPNIWNSEIVCDECYFRVMKKRVRK